MNISRQKLENDRQREWNVVELERFCDRVGQDAVARGLTEEKLKELLADES